MGRLRELLDEKGVLLADGATGTNFFNMGLVSGDAPELWNDDEPEKVLALHQGFVDAGADIILTNTFGANRHRLKLHNAQDRATELSKKAAQLARQVADGVDHPVLVAGSVGPTGELFEPLGELTREAAMESFTEQMIGLRDYLFTASFDTAGRTMMGITPTQLMEIATTRPQGPVAVGANCGVGATDLLYSILDMTAAPQDKIAVVAKANCGVPRVSGDKVIYTGTPELMADYARFAMDAGATITGGCCGTSYEHLAAMRGAVDTHTKRDRPQLTDVVAATGPLVNEISQAAESKSGESGGGRRRGGRRR